MNKTRLFLLFILTILLVPAHAEDEAKRALDDAKSLADKGDYEAALAKHVWFHDNALAIRPSYYGVRLSFALSYWAELGEKYPKALETLRGIRDAKTAKLLAGGLNRSFFTMSRLSIDI